MSVICLTWPNYESYKDFNSQFGLFCISQGFVQILLNKYQLARLYKEKTIGKAQKMDVVGDGIESTNL